MITGPGGGGKRDGERQLEFTFQCCILHCTEVILKLRELCLGRLTAFRLGFSFSIRQAGHLDPMKSIKEKSSIYAHT